MRLSQHQIDIAFATIGIMLIIAYIFLFQRPLNGKLKELRSEIRGFLENGPPRENMESKLDQLNQAKAKLNQEIQLLETGFFKADRVWDLMQSLTDMAEGAGLTVILVHPQIKTESDRYQQGSLLIRLSGDFLSFYRFLVMFEKATPSVKANSLKIEAQPESSLYLAEIQFDLITMPP